MKFFNLAYLMFLLAIGLTTNLFAMEQDKINVFLQEFIDGKPQKEFIHFELTVYSMSEKGSNKWLLSEENFSTVENEKCVTVELMQSRSNDDYDNPFIKDVKWIPGKELQCVYEPFHGGDDVRLTAKKGNGGKYDWDVYCVGSYKWIGSGPAAHKWEFKSVKEETLEFNKLKFESIYYRKDE